MYSSLTWEYPGRMFLPLAQKQATDPEKACDESQTRPTNKRAARNAARIRRGVPLPNMLYCHQPSQRQPRDRWFITLPLEPSPWPCPTLPRLSSSFRAQQPVIISLYNFPLRDCEVHFLATIRLCPRRLCDGSLSPVALSFYDARAIHIATMYLCTYLRSAYLIHQ